ncbi:MAG: AbrB/MazE/SpoVT family DNA-binding domain-containing protein [Eubacteriales bacterium]|nr:AbrB/MazE/SpoVT family DNA-binding domain-containing protein [Eubacteriales bacterium]
MKATGIVRTVDELGRIVLPKELRRTLNINDRDSMEIYVDGDCIILKKYQRGCTMCGESTGIVVIDGITFCRRCLQNIAEVAEMSNEHS